MEKWLLVLWIDGCTKDILNICTLSKSKSHFVSPEVEVARLLGLEDPVVEEWRQFGVLLEAERQVLLEVILVDVDYVAGVRIERCHCDILQARYLEEQHGYLHRVECACMKYAVSSRSRMKRWTISGMSIPPLVSMNEFSSFERLGSSFTFFM